MIERFDMLSGTNNELQFSILDPVDLTRCTAGKFY